jgi:chemotaxis protein CheX
MNSAHGAHAAAPDHTVWIPLLEMSTREVFELMLSSELTLAQNVDTTSLDVTAMVGLAGQLCGVLSVRCGGHAAALMTSKMLGVEVDKVGPEMSDALGEVCNMVAGNFKNKISGLAEGCMLSPPTVITGNDYSLHSQAEEPGLQVEMLFEGMPMIVSLQIQA